MGSTTNVNLLGLIGTNETGYEISFNQQIIGLPHPQKP